MKVKHTNWKTSVKVKQANDSEPTRRLVVCHISDKCCVNTVMFDMHATLLTEVSSPLSAIFTLRQNRKKKLSATVRTNRNFLARCCSENPLSNEADKSNSITTGQNTCIKKQILNTVRQGLWLKLIRLTLIG